MGEEEFQKIVFEVGQILASSAKNTYAARPQKCRRLKELINYN